MLFILLITDTHTHTHTHTHVTLPDLGCAQRAAAAPWAG